MAVATAQIPAWMRRTGRWLITAFEAFMLLFYGMLWVATVGDLAMSVGLRAFGEDEGSLMLSAACSVIQYSLTVVFKLFPFAVAGILISWRVKMQSMPKDPKKAVKDPPAPVVFGGLFFMAFMTFIAAGDFAVIQRSRVGPILRDLVPLSIALTFHFIMLPAYAPRWWRMK